MLARFAVRHPVTVLMLVAGGVLLGALSLLGLPVDLLPALDAPRLAIQLRSGDRPPEELEDRYARPLEAVLATLPNVRSVRTTSSAGRVLATVEYDWDANMDFALLDVQTRVAPFATDRDVDSLVVRRFDPSAEPIVVLALTDASRGGGAGGDAGDLDALRRLADDRVARTLERVPGVASVQVGGGRKREVRVEVERDRLAALGLSIDRIVSLIQQSNAEASGGTVEDRGRVHVIKGLGSFTKLDDIADLPISAGRAGSVRAAPMRLGDVADVRWDDAPVRGLVTVDGREGVSLSIFKEAGANTVQVSRRVQDAVAVLGRDLRDVHVVVVRDQAEFIRRAITEVKTAAVVGSVLSVLVLLFFLRSMRAIVLVAAAIPVSILVTFGLMALANVTLNLMTLGGLALGAGMLVDDAIVVLEAIFRRVQAGEDSFTAAERGTTEVAGAVVASTLTTCVVFLPVVFLHGIAAELFTDLAFTVTFSLLCSLGVALVVIPPAAARLFRRGAGSVMRGELTGRYERLLRVALGRPRRVLAFVGALVLGAALLAPRIALDFLPAANADEVTAHLLLPEGTRVTVTREAADRLQEAVKQAAPDAVAVAMAELGEAVRDDTVLSEEISSENRGVLRLRLRAERHVSAERVMRVVDRAAAALESVTVRFEPADAVLGRVVESGPPVRVEVRGQDLVALEHATAAVASALATLPELFNVHSSFEDRRADVRIDLDRPLAAGLALTPDEVARQLRQRLGAQATTTFRPDGEDRDVVVRLAPQSLTTLPQLVLDTPSSGPVRLGDVAKVTVVSTPTRIERSLAVRMGVVSAQVAEGATLGAAARRIERALPHVPLPQGVRAELAGAETARRSSFKELVFAVVLAIALVYMVMASLFESVVHPFTILFTLPTAGAGVVVAMFLTGTPVSVPALLGVVMLAGIAVKNGILLVDVTGALRAEGHARREALVLAGRSRLRPILMTSATTVLGMLPLAIARGEGAEMRAPMAIAVLGGLTASTLLTLFLIPVVYEMLDRLRPSGRRASS